MKGVYIFLAEGFEDMEAIATRDVLVRGGIEVGTVSITEEPYVLSSHEVEVVSDMDWETFKQEVLDEEGTSSADVMIFPGGMPGTKNLAGHKELMQIMKRHYDAGGAVAAICAAPGLVASQLDGLQGKKFTCFEGFQEPMTAKGAVYVPESVVTDGRLITGRGAGYAVAFGLEILRYLRGDEAVAKVKAGLML